MPPSDLIPYHTTAYIHHMTDTGQIYDSNQHSSCVIIRGFHSSAIYWRSTQFGAFVLPISDRWWFGSRWHSMAGQWALSPARSPISGGTGLVMSYGRFGRSEPTFGEQCLDRDSQLGRPFLLEDRPRATQVFLWQHKQYIQSPWQHTNRNQGKLQDSIFHGLFHWGT